MVVVGGGQHGGDQVPRAGDDPAAFDHGGHGHTAMAGMLTEKEMDRLRAARGKAFDELFLRGMIAHHAGAVEMASRSRSTAPTSGWARSPRTWRRDSRPRSPGSASTCAASDTHTGPPPPEG